YWMATSGWPAKTLSKALQCQARAQLGLRVRQRSIKPSETSMSSPKYPSIAAASARTLGSSGDAAELGAEPGGDGARSDCVDAHPGEGPPSRASSAPPPRSVAADRYEARRRQVYADYQ